MKKILFSSIAAFLLFATIMTPAIAAGKAEPAATGTIGWINTGNGAQATDSFDAHQLSSCIMWDITGNYTFYIRYSNSDFYYAVNLIQTGNTVTGSLNDPYLPSGEQDRHINGTISGNTFQLLAVYPAGPWGTRTFNGTVDSLGNLSGSWFDNGTDNASGTWSATSGVAAPTGAGCNGKGTFTYSDTSGIFYTMDVRFVNVDKATNTAWFAGPTVSGNFGIGSWIFIKVVDKGQPGIGNDQIWGEGGDMTEAQAQSKVASMANPLGGPFTINSGNLVVHN